MLSKIFLVGNGSSLKETNLDLLVGKPSMAVNKIHLHYPKTKWRPTHYLKIDYSTFDNSNWKDEVRPHIDNNEMCLLWHAFHGGITSVNEQYNIHGGFGDLPNVEYIGRCEHHDTGKGEWHEICTGLNSILAMTIWAVKLGYKEIILIGCDGYFSDPKHDHFIDNYYNEVDGKYAERNNKNVQEAHDIIKAKCPVKVYDATVNGKLTQYEKARLEDCA